MNSIVLRATGLPVDKVARVEDRGAINAVERMDIISDAASLLELEPYWDAILERSAIRTPFMRWDWMNLWRQECGDDFELAIAVVRDESGKPLAIAPFVLGRGVYGARRHLRVITFVGCVGHITTEGMDFLIPAGEEAHYAPLLCRAFTVLQERWDAIHLHMMHEESPCLPFIKAAVREFAVGLSLIDRMPSHLVSLPATWTEVELSHGQNWRSNHRRKWKKMIDTFRGRTLQGGADLTPQDSFNVLLDLHSQRWTKEESEFLRSDVIQFHRRLVDKWMPQGRLMLPIIELEGLPAAASYTFVDFGRIWFYQAGWVDRYGSISLGKMSTAWMVQCAQARGVRELDFLPGDSGYKREWGDHLRHVTDLEAFNPHSIRAWAFLALRGLKRRLRPAPESSCERGQGDDGAMSSS